jgi:hypothetical protein
MRTSSARSRRFDQAGLDEPDRRYAAWSGVGQRALLPGRGARYRDAFLEAFRIAERNRWTERMAPRRSDISSYLMRPTLSFARARSRSRPRSPRSVPSIARACRCWPAAPCRELPERRLRADGGRSAKPWRSPSAAATRS